MLLRSGTIINNDKARVIKSDTPVLLDAWVLTYICHKCSNSGYNFVNDQRNNQTVDELIGYICRVERHLRFPEYWYMIKVSKNV